MFSYSHRRRIVFPPVRFHVEPLAEVGGRHNRPLVWAMSGFASTTIGSPPTNSSDLGERVMQVRLVLYVSESTAPLTRVELQALNYSCRVANQRSGLTGLMLYSSGNFMQAIEGNPLRVREALERIHRDVRHMNIRTLIDEITGERTFGEWAMGLIEVDALRPIDLDRLSMAMRAAAKAEDGRDKRRHGRIALQLFRDFAQQTAA